LLQRFPVGDAFLKIAEYFRTYTVFCGTREHYAVLYERLLKENSKFAKFLRTRVVEVPAIRGLDLSSYLIKPVQRLCKYPLLLKELLKYTLLADPGYASLEKAYVKINEVASYVNDKTRYFASRSQVAELQVSINLADNLQLVQPDRRLVRDGLFTECTPEIDKKKWHTRQYILFNDLLLVVRPKKKTSKYMYEFICKMALKTLQVTGILIEGENQFLHSGIEITNGSVQTIIIPMVDGDESITCAEWLDDLEYFIEHSNDPRGRPLLRSADGTPDGGQGRGRSHSIGQRPRSASRTIAGVVAPVGLSTSTSLNVLSSHLPSTPSAPTSPRSPSRFGKIKKAIFVF